MQGCIFCQADKIKNDVLSESENFFVKVGVGILAPGHVMIIPKAHITCFGELPARLNEEFLLLKEDVVNKVKLHFSEPVEFEHGIYGQSISHAHIHIIPIKSEHYNLVNVRKNLFGEMKSTKIDNFLRVAEIFREEGSYLYLKEKNYKWILHTKNIPNGKYVFRKRFAEFTGFRELADWKTMPLEEQKRNLEWVERTKKCLKS